MIRSGRGIAPPGGKRVEAADRLRDLGRRSLALHAHRPHQHVDGKAIGEAMQDVADHRARRRGDDADDARQIGQQLLARGVEQPLFGKLAPARLEQRHQRADARRLQRFDDDLVGGLAGKGGDLAGDDDLEPFLGLDPHAAENALPDHRVEPGAGVLEREIDVAGRMRAAIAGDLAAHPHVAEAVLDRALEGARQFADREFGRVGAGDVENRSSPGDYAQARPPRPAAVRRPYGAGRKNAYKPGAPARSGP